MSRVYDRLEKQLKYGQTRNPHKILMVKHLGKWPFG
jgi:hypothetical protein